MEQDIKVKDNSTSDVASLSIAQVNDAKLVRKIDLHVVPVLCLLYTLAFLDRWERGCTVACENLHIKVLSRVNIGNASIFGLKQDLHLEGNQYNTALVIL